LPAGSVADETVHVRVSSALYDRICKIALRIDKPISTVARLMIEHDVARLEARLARALGISVSPK
jgi:hypothetical protein